MQERSAGGSVEQLAGSLYGGTQRALEAGYLRWRYGVPIRAAQEFHLDEVGFGASDRSGYGPSPWGVLRRILSPVEMTTEDVFVDFGCGMGRVVLEAARHPFRRVIGIDVVPEFVAVARSVIGSNRRALRCGDVELEVADARDYHVPDDVTIAYFANPFSIELVETVLAKLLRSTERYPRSVRVIYLAPPPLPPLEDLEGTRFVRYGRRRVRRWALTNYLALYELAPPEDAVVVAQ